jgi:hypothetical protein
MAAKNSADSPESNKNVPVEVIDTSDQALASLLKRLKTSVDPNEIRELSHQIEQVVFHKQFENA